MISSVPTRLNLKPDQTVLVENLPADYNTLIATLGAVAPVTTDEQRESSYDVIMAFFYRQAEIKAQFNDLITHLTPGGRLWLVYPRKSVTPKTDLSRDTLNQVIETEFEWQGANLIALDDTWSALRVSPPQASD